MKKNVTRFYDWYLVDKITQDGKVFCTYYWASVEGIRKLGAAAGCKTVLRGCPDGRVSTCFVKNRYGGYSKVKTDEWFLYKHICLTRARAACSRCGSCDRGLPIVKEAIEVLDLERYNAVIDDILIQ